MSKEHEMFTLIEEFESSNYKGKEFLQSQRRLSPHYFLFISTKWPYPDHL